MENAMTEREGAVLTELDRRTQAFELRFLRVVAAGLSMSSVVALLSFIAMGAGALPVLCLGMVSMATASAFGVSFLHEGRRLAAGALLFGIAVSAGAGLMLDGRGVLGMGAIEALLVAAVLAPFVLERRSVIILTLLEIVLVLAGHALMLAQGVPAQEVVAPALGTALVLAVASTSISLFVGHANENQGMLRNHLREIDIVVERAERIARGDLSGTVTGEGEAPRVIGEMLSGLRGLVEQVQTNAAEVSTASREIAAMAQQQERSAIEQSSAIEETRRTVSGLLEAARQIATAAQGVADNAQATLTNAGVIHERIRTLTTHAERITEVLEFIRDVANKSELLALNAALEGAKAGDAGRGFSLVASQMQRLAESVMESVKTVRDLTGDIRRATQATAIATEDATKLAGETTTAAQRIGVITGEQQVSTEQVTRAIDEIADATRQAAAGTNQTLQAVRDLSQVATRLDEYAARFQI
jgi:methyl-accepting chemotaxis protein